MSRPDVVNVVFYDSRAAFAALDGDPDFQAVVPLRAASIEMASVEGMLIGGALTSDALERRTYLIEIARYGSQGAAGYARYEAEAEPVMKRYGYHVERLLAPDSAAAFPFKPDLVKVAWFDHPDGLVRLHQDAAHDRIERELYPAAVEQSLWVTGRVHPMTFAGSA